MIKALSVLTLLFIGNLAIGQTFHLKSFDGSEKSINLFPVDEKGLLTITCAKDTVKINDFTGIDTGVVLNKNFLLVRYSIRGGSGMHVRRSLILSVRDNIICQSLHITSLFSEEFIDFRKQHKSSDLVDVSSLYKVDFSLKGNDMSNYLLNTMVHDEKKSKDAPQTNYNHDYDIILSFDTSRNVFYNKLEPISQYFTIFDPKTSSEIKQYIMGTFPMVKLGQYKYYYIKGEWYEKDDESGLSKYSYK